MKDWSFLELDGALAAELRPFLPDQVFDAHAHLYRVSDLNTPVPPIIGEGAEQASLDSWRCHVGKPVYGRLVGGLFFGFPAVNADLERVNAYVMEQVRQVSGARALLLVSPGARLSLVEEQLKAPNVAGFKPYYCYGVQGAEGLEADMGDWLPDWTWEVSHDRGLVIMLHVVKSRALEDPGNQEYLIRKCGRYPNAKVVLAHCGRAFNASTAWKGVPALRGLSNIWFDCAAICEAGPILAILENFGPKRIMWGSDFPVSQSRGRCVTVGDGFLWITEKEVDKEEGPRFCSPTLISIESLRALKEAADRFPLQREDLEDIFCRNARRLLGIEAQERDVTQRLYRRARQRIPGGVQLLSKRPEMAAPGQWPAYFREARGCEIWDLDDRHYFDRATNGIGACLLGYREPDVTRAVLRRVGLGAMSTLNPPEEVALADLLCSLHPWAEQVRLARCGGEVAAVAVRIARATTDRSEIAICGYHGWHDWYLSANLGEQDSLRGHLLPGLDPLGVPRELRGTAHTFRYNMLEDWEKVMSRCGRNLAAVIMEPARYNDPNPGFLEAVQEGARKLGALLIFDEITIGWRLNCGGSHLKFGVTPDMAIFAKALGNGHPIAAVIGTREAMQGAHTSFISSTYWTESVGPAAALATLQKMQSVDVPAHVRAVGSRVMAGWEKSARHFSLPVVVEPGYPCLAHFRFDHELAGELKTLYTQYMLERGYLASTVIYPTLAHTDTIVEGYLRTIHEVFGEIAERLRKGTVVESLKGPVAHTGFRRLL